MDVKKFWITMIAGVAVISIVFGGLFWYNYCWFNALDGGWHAHPLFLAIGGLIGVAWCALLFLWTFSVVMDKVRAFLFSALGGVMLLTAAIELIKLSD